MEGVMPKQVPPQFTVLSNSEFGPNPRGLNVHKIFEKHRLVQSVILERPHQFVEVVRHSFVLLDCESPIVFRFQPASDPNLPAVLRQSRGVYWIGDLANDEAVVRKAAYHILGAAQAVLSVERRHSFMPIASGVHPRC
jgi:hypothetical protein